MTQSEPVEAAQKMLGSFALTDTALQKLEVLRPQLLEIRCAREKRLLEAREQLRMPNYKPDPKDKDTPRYTDFDRRIMLEAGVAELNEAYELALGIEKLVAERVQLLTLWLNK